MRYFALENVLGKVVDLVDSEVVNTEKMLPEYMGRPKGTLLGGTGHPCNWCWNTTQWLLPLHSRLMRSLLLAHEPINIEGESVVFEGVKGGRSSLLGCRLF